MSGLKSYEHKTENPHVQEAELIIIIELLSLFKLLVNTDLLISYLTEFSLVHRFPNCGSRLPTGHEDTAGGPQ